jgi:hypothetical protein
MQNTAADPARQTHPRRRLATALVVGALLLGAAGAALAASPGGAAVRFPPATEAEAREDILGWTLSAYFPNVRAWPESFSALAFPNKCLYLSVVPCP